MEQNNQNTSSDIEQVARKGAEVGIDAARATKTVAKAGAMAASGNIAGAAVEVAKDGKTIKFIVGAVAAIMIIVTMVSLLAPIAIYEAVDAAVSHLSDEWQERAAASDGNAVSRGIKAAFGILFDRVKNVFNSIKSLFVPGDIPEENDQYSISNDRHMADIYERKLQATIKSASRRIYDDLAPDILKNSDFCQASNAAGLQEGSHSASGQASSSSWLYKKFENVFMSTPEFNQGRMFGSCAYFQKYTYGGVSLTVHWKDMQPLKALGLITLYEVLTSDTPDDVLASGYMKWLGNGDSQYFDITYGIGKSGYVRRDGYKALKGGFMPKYLVKEEVDIKYDDLINGSSASRSFLGFLTNIIKGKTNRIKYDAHKVSPLDMMIVIDAPEPNSVTPNIAYGSPCYMETVEGYSCGYTLSSHQDEQHNGYTLTQLSAKHSAPQYNLAPLNRKKNTWTRTATPTAKLTPLEFNWYEWGDYVIGSSETDEDEVEETPEPIIVYHDHYLSNHLVTYHYDVYIQFRDIEDIINAACLYDGRLGEATQSKNAGRGHGSGGTVFYNRDKDGDGVTDSNWNDYNNTNGTGENYTDGFYVAPDADQHLNYFNGGVLYPSESPSAVPVDDVIAWLKENTDWNDTMIAAILTNISYECSFDLNAVGDNGCAFGLFQWNDRRYNMFDYIGDDWKTNWQKQLEFMIYECETTETEGYGLARNAAESGTTDALARATFWWAAQWERCSDPYKRGENVATQKYYLERVQNWNP